MPITAFGATDIGKKRELNEDAFRVRADLGLVVVADGAGGHNAGEVASALAVRAIESHIERTQARSATDGPMDRFGVSRDARRLSAAVHRANQAILELARSSEQHRGMGTTVVASLYSPDRAHLHVAHVGDSRCYRLRAGELEQLTTDHSLGTDILEQRPELDDVVMRRLPSHVVTRALGMDRSLRVSVRSHDVLAGDRFLLCSDGLTRCVGDRTLERHLATDFDAESLVAVLLDAANEAGGSDNITAALLDFASVDHDARASEVETTTQSEPDHDDDDPELLILGIEELDERFDGAGDSLLDLLKSRFHDS